MSLHLRLLAALLVIQRCHNALAFAPASTHPQQKWVKYEMAKPARPTSTWVASLRDEVHARRHAPSSLGMTNFPDIPSILTSVETFDGSTVDPVVVSNVFWSALQGKIIAVIIGQLLAAAAFAVLSSVAASQLSKLGDYVTKNVFNQDTRDAAGANVARFASSVVEKGKSPTVQPDFRKLIACIIIDTIGSSSELIPIVGEVTDVVWAPIAGLALRSLYGSNVLFALEFAEEILPLTDIIPLATLCWVVETFYGDSDVAKALQIGQFGSGTVIDVRTNDVPERKLLTDAVENSDNRLRR